MNSLWQTTRFDIDLRQPKVMGIVNVTPDSFFDGGRHGDALSAAQHCEQLVYEGADILDIGGESTRPGSPPVPLEDELARVLPVLRDAMTLGVPISIDTYKPEVMQAALDLGADIVNDIWALRQASAQGGASAEDVVARHPRCGVCLMHMHGEPQTMQINPLQTEVLPEVLRFLQQRTQALLGLGIEKSRILWDMGIGFGKTVEQNFALLAEQPQLLQDGYPLLAGWSRKSSLGAVTGLPVDERMIPSLVAAVLAVERGARIVRVHDVRETVSVLKVWKAATHRASTTPSGA